MIRNVFFALAIFVFAIGTSAQSISNQTYRTLGIQIHTTGWGLNYSHFFDNPKFGLDGLNFDYMTQNVFGERKDNRETLNQSKLVINKINHLYNFRVGGVRSWELGTRHSRSNVGVNGIVSLGPMISLFKPVFIEYSASDSSLVGVEDVRYDPQIHRARQIFRRSAFSTGLGESSPRVGAYFKSSLRFDWGSYQSNFKALEIGLNINYIQNPKEIIYQLGPKNVYVNMFLMLSFGKILE